MSETPAAVDLPAQLLAAITAKLELARAATEGPWRVVDEIDGVRAGRATVVKAGERRVVTVDQVRAHWDSAHAPGRAEDNVAHIAANDPASVIRRCERDLRVLDRHTPDRLPVNPAFWSCEACSVEAGDYVNFVDWPCPEIVDLAYDLGIPTKEETDGT